MKVDGKWEIFHHTTGRSKHPPCALSANRQTWFFKISFSSHIIHSISHYTIYTTKWKLYKLKNRWGVSHKRLFYVVSSMPLLCLVSNLLFDMLMLRLKRKPKESFLTKHLNKCYTTRYIHHLNKHNGKQIYTNNYTNTIETHMYKFLWKTSMNKYRTQI